LGAFQSIFRKIGCRFGIVINLLCDELVRQKLLRAFVGDGPVLTDDKPVVEYFLSLPRDRDVDTSSLKGDVSRYIVPE